MDFATLRNEALANFEGLLDMYGVEWQKVSEYEYDLKNPNREDKNFGSCKFNVLKGIGIDFALPWDANYKVLGDNFDASDYAAIDSNGNEEKAAFDVIGLSQRVHHATSYTDAAMCLLRDLVMLKAKQGSLVDGSTAEAIRREKIASNRAFIKNKGMVVWSRCSPILGSISENYFKNRMIENAIQEDNIKFHPSVMNREAKTYFPCVIQKVSPAPDGPVAALHRLYLDPTGHSKAPVDNPKMSYGSVKGCGVWLGTPGGHLYIAEGLENALTLRKCGAEFVVSTVSSTNFPSLVIPDYVEWVTLAGDNDAPGIAAKDKAVEEYKNRQRKLVSVVLPQAGHDWNSQYIDKIRREAKENGQQ